MKKFLVVLLLGMFVSSNSLVLAATPAKKSQPVKKAAPAKPVAQTQQPAAQLSATASSTLQYKPNAQTMVYAFVFDGPNEKNEKVLAQFQKEITKSTAPEFKASFPKEYVFVGDWTVAGAKAASDKAFASKSAVVVSLGYLSSKYISGISNKNKFAVTIDQYGLRDIGEGFFNPIAQNAKGITLFQNYMGFKKAAILMNEAFYKTRSDWDKVIAQKVPGVDFKVIPVGSDISGVVSKLDGCDAVVFTPLFNLSPDQKKELISQINAKKLPSFSTLGKEDVELGVFLGTGAYDLDRKVAEAASFNIHGALKSGTVKPSPIQFYEEEIIYVNKDTAEEIGHVPHLRLLNTAEVISNKPPVVYNLTSVFTQLENENLDIARKKLLIKAARRSSTAAILRYLPTFGVTVGYQSYNHDYAKSVALSVPEKTGIFSMGLEQVIYSPALVTNILIKRKGVDFSKAEAKMTEQNMGLEVAQLYVDSLILDNLLAIQRDHTKESRENLAIARVREKRGDCGREEALRWASQLSANEQKLLDMEAESKNVKIAMNTMLTKDPREQFKLAPLTSADPAFYTSEIHIIDYVITEPALEKFTQMLIEESYRVAPELEKLRAAIKMKEYERAMYIQKFVLPDAKLSVDYTSLANREFGAPQAQLYYPAPIGMQPIPRPEATNLRFGIFAQWKPIEGGTKFAEIARINAEREELKKYEQEVKAELEAHIRETINKALAAYFSIRKDVKAYSASAENYQYVKARYLNGKASISEIQDAQDNYLESKARAMNAQYVFFKELLWVQRGICAVNWTKASPEAKQFIQSIKDNLEKKSDFTFL